MTGKFRLKKTTLGVEKATHMARSIPQDSIIEILCAPPKGQGVVDVVWDGREMFVPVQDLRDRSEPICETAANPSNKRVPY